MSDLPHLLVVQGPEMGRRISVPPTGAKLGRLGDNEILIHDPTMSRQQCRFFFKENDGLWVADQGSANETLVNGRPIVQSRAYVGDLLTLGETVVKVLNDGRPANLLVEEGPDKGLALVIPPDGTRIGRVGENQINLSDPSMSRQQCRLFYQDGALWVADLGSANQTLVNNRPVSETRLKSGDQITLGQNIIGVVRDQPIGMRPDLARMTQLIKDIPKPPEPEIKAIKPPRSRHNPNRPKMVIKAQSDAEPETPAQKTVDVAKFIPAAVLALLVGAAIMFGPSLLRRLPTVSPGLPPPTIPTVTTDVAVTESEQLAITPPAPETSFTNAVPVPETGKTATEGQANLVLESDPPGATATLNGQPAGRTPCTVRGLTLGEVRVELALFGFQPYSQTLTLTNSGDELLTATLVPTEAKTTRPSEEDPEATAARTALLLPPVTNRPLREARARVIPAPIKEITIASLFGGSGSDKLTACAIDSTGVAFLGGTYVGDLPAGIRSYRFPGGSSGILIRYDITCGEIIAATRVPGNVDKIVIDAQDQVYFSAGGSLFKCNNTLTKVFWTASAPGRFDITADGGAWALKGLTVTGVDPQGGVTRSWTIPNQDTGTHTKRSDDIAVDRINRQVIVCGNNSGNSKTSGNPVFVPWVFAYDFEGNLKWQMYNFSHTDVDSVGDMADSRANRLCFGPDNKLYLLGDSEGGNTPFRHSPLKLGEELAPSVFEGNQMTEMWKAFSARKITFVARVNPLDGNVEKASFFYGKRFDTEKNREEIGATLGRAIAVDGSGRVILTGVAQCKLPFTPDAVHRESSGETHKNNYGHPVGADEGFLAIFSPDLNRLESCTGVSQGSADYNSYGHCVDAGAGAIVMVGHAVKPASADGQPVENTVYLRDSVIPDYGGGHDGYFLIRGGIPVTDPAAMLATQFKRLGTTGAQRVARECQKTPRFDTVAAQVETAIANAASASNVVLAAEMREALSAIDDVGRMLLFRALRSERENPPAALDLYQLVSSRWGKLDRGQKATERAVTLGKDPVFMRDVEASRVFIPGVLMPSRALKVPEGSTASYLDAEFVHANQTLLRTMEAKTKALNGQWPEAPQTAKALAICRSLLIPITPEEQSAFRALQSLVDRERALKPLNDAKPVASDPRFARRYSIELAGMRTAIKTLQEKWPGSPYAAKAQEIATKYEL